MQKTENDIALVWFENDLRTVDQASLYQATKNHRQVIACYCFDPIQFEIGQFGFKKTERFRAQFLLQTVSDLKVNLKNLGIELFSYHKAPELAIPALVKQFKISTIYYQLEWTQEETEQLNKVKAAIDTPIQYQGCYDQFLYHPDDIAMEFKNIPKVFTDFRKYLENKCEIRPFVSLGQQETNITIENTSRLPSLKELGFEDFETDGKTAFPFKGGETSALQRLKSYVFESKKIATYKKTRNGLIGIDYSSKFSPWLANGSLSPRTIYWAIKEFENKHEKNDSTYWLIFELIWRDFFKYISLKHGNAIFKIGGILNKSYDWRTDDSDVVAWINGKTSEDFVNANMIEFKKTGWMSNRGRQNVASYFAKELQLDWRIGAAYFESMLLDYDVHSNYGNWMYVAGVGNDPRDRKYNVSSQAERYDAQGNYRRLWLQETLF